MRSNTCSSSEELRMLRAEYFAKTIFTLSLQLWFTFGSVLLVNGNDRIKQYFVEHFNDLSGTGFIGSFISLWWMSNSTHPTSFQLGCFTVFQTISICTIAPFFEHLVLVGVIGVTLVITLALAIIAYFSKRFNTHTEHLMLCILTTLLVGGIANLFFKSPFIRMLELYVGILLFMAYIVLDVHHTLDQYITTKHQHPNIHIYACVNIYLDILNLFVRLLQVYSLYIQKKNKNDGR